MSPCRAVAYLRTATAEPGHEEKLRAQEHTIRQWAARHDCDIVGVYSDIGSGYTDQRPGLQQLLADARAKTFEVILVTDLARLFRNSALLRENYSLLNRELGICLFPVNLKGPSE